MAVAGAGPSELTAACSGAVDAAAVAAAAEQAAPSAAALLWSWCVESLMIRMLQPPRGCCDAVAATMPATLRRRRRRQRACLAASKVRPSLRRWPPPRTPEQHSKSTRASMPPLATVICGGAADPTLRRVLNCARGKGLGHVPRLLSVSHNAVNGRRRRRLHKNTSEVSGGGWPRHWQRAMTDNRGDEDFDLDEEISDDENKIPTPRNKASTGARRPPPPPPCYPILTPC